MRLPNGEHAVVDLSKLRNYCLNKEHPEGRHKARLFLAALGLTAAEAEDLKEALLGAARSGNAIPGQSDEHGQRFVVDFAMRRGHQEARIRSAWIIRRGEDFPRVTSCFVL
ncbi:MAG: DUF6883 domain-containing protein [Sulfuricaulis sp.]|uniref:DUF6883 domain-containing protein n=1 Tax=Sulfuricaulis sp. TaxID=2003553 RepID=UPI0034A2091E